MVLPPEDDSSVAGTTTPDVLRLIVAGLPRYVLLWKNSSLTIALPMQPD